MGGVDLTALPLSPLEGFVLSRIDGESDVSTLADLTSIDVTQVGTIVGRLVELGAAEWITGAMASSLRAPVAEERVVVPDNLRRPPPVSDRPVVTTSSAPPGDAAQTRPGRRRKPVPRTRTGPLQVPPEPIAPPTDTVSRNTYRRPSKPVLHTDSVKPPRRPGSTVPSRPRPRPPKKSDSLSSLDLDALQQPPANAVGAAFDGADLDSLVTDPVPPPGDFSAPEGSEPLISFFDEDIAPPAEPQPELPDDPPSERPTVRPPAGPANAGPIAPPLDPGVGIALPDIDLGPIAAPTDPSPALAADLEPEAIPIPALDGAANAASTLDVPLGTFGTSDAPPAAEALATDPFGSLEEPLTRSRPLNTPAPVFAEPSSGARLLTDADQAASGRTHADEPTPVVPVHQMAELDEELDIDPERRKEVDSLWVALDLLDHYEVLGVPRAADKREVRSAYFSLSKRMHPDTMFRKRLGSYKPKMESIFQRATEAYEVLSRKRRREEYDRYLEMQDRTRAVEAVVFEAEQEAQRRSSTPPEPITAVNVPSPSELLKERDRKLNEERRRKSSRPPPPDVEPGRPAVLPEPVPASAADTTPDARPSVQGPDKELVRRLIAHRLRAALGGRAAFRDKTPGPAPPAPTPEPPPRRPKPAPRKPVDPRATEAVRRLATSIKSSAQHSRGGADLDSQLLEAREAEARGDIAEAVKSLRLAHAFAPDRQDIQTNLERLQQALAADLAEDYEQQALYEQEHGKWKEAAVSWSKVFEGRPSDARAARLAAEAIVNAGGDLHKAQELAQKAADLRPGEVANSGCSARSTLPPASS